MRTKLTSRKFWLAVTNFVSMLLVLFNVADTQATKITALIMAGGSLIAYIIGEGFADSSDTVIQNYESEFPMPKPTEENVSYDSLEVRVNRLEYQLNGTQNDVIELKNILKRE